MTLPRHAARLGGCDPPPAGEFEVLGDEAHQDRDPRLVESRPPSAADGWRSRAACQHEDPELFFPPGRDDVATAQIAAAKAVCARCPVRRQCLEFAVTHRQRDGIWGGLTDRERRGRR